MSARELLERLLASGRAGVPIDVPLWREEIHNEHDKAETVADRELLLSAQKAIMDTAERQIVDSANLEKFRTTRSQDHNLLLVKEAMIGITDGNVRPHLLAAITKREVAAGRRDPDSELHRVALAGEAVMTAPKPGLFSDPCSDGGRSQ